MKNFKRELKYNAFSDYEKFNIVKFMYSDLVNKITHSHKQISFLTLTNDTMENFERELKYIAFQNYEKFNIVKFMYSDLVNKITQKL